MKSWKHLPGEILDLIFGIVLEDSGGSRYLCRCQLTCKNWSEHAQVRLYEKIRIFQHKTFSKLLATLYSTEYKPACYVKNILMQVDEEFFYLLLLRCPKLEVIDGGLSRGGGVLKALQEACERGACKHLERIPSLLNITSEVDKQMYINIIYYLRASLRELYVYENYTIPTNAASRLLLQNLNEFPVLRALTVNLDSMKTFYQIGKYIACCKNLDRLNLRGYYCMGMIANMLPDVHSLDICPTIKYLHLHGIYVTKKLLEYIMHAFPNLNSFHIRHYRDSRHSDDTIPNFLWLQFFTFIRNMKKNSYAWVGIADIPGVLADYFSMKRSDAHIRINYGTTTALPYVCIKNSKEKTEDRHVPIEVCLSSRYDRDTRMSTKLLHRAGGFLKSLIYVKERFDGTEFGGSTFVDFVCQQCPSLEKLEFSNLNFFYRNTMQVQTNTSIKEITVNSCTIPNELFTELSIRFPSLSILRIKYCDRVNSDGTPLQGYHNLVIEIPNISLDTLAWSWSTDFCIFGNVSLRIDTRKKSYYYVTDEVNDSIESPSVLFQKLWNDKAVLSLHIHCQEIKTLDFTFKTRPWDIKLDLVSSK
jgi:hypothetical protein